MIPTHCARRWPSLPRAQDPTKRNFASIGRTARYAGASGQRRRRVDKGGRVVRVSGVTVDITERKRAEERQNLLTREVDHRAKNALALAQSIVRLTRAQDVDAYVQAVEGRITRAGPGSYHSLIVELAGRGNKEAGRRGTRAIFRGRPDQVLAVPKFSCSPRRRKHWRSPCTNSSPIRRNMARSPRCPAACRSDGKYRGIS